MKNYNPSYRNQFKNKTPYILLSTTQKKKEKNITKQKKNEN